MKSIFRGSIAWLSAAALIVASGCADILEEEPRSMVSPEYFETAEGLRSGVDAGYAGFRYYYGTEGGMATTVFGTDEFTSGRDGTSDLNIYGQGLNPNEGHFVGVWNRSYTFVNSLNGVIDIAPESSLNENDRRTLVAEAKYLRAHYYFLLVQYFGDVTIDLGSGPWRFNTTPSTAQERAPRSEVYEGIINDLEDAIIDLPEQAQQPGRADEAAARHLLAKVYLTRAGTLDNDSDYDRAYEEATYLIENAGAYGVELLEDFGEVHAQGNEHNNEVLWTVERTTNVSFNTTPGRDGLDENRSNYFFRPFYENAPGVGRSMEYGRPWIRYRPTDYLLNVAFAERENDSRFDNSFQMIWYANAEGMTNPDEVPEGMQLGDTALYFPGYEMPQDEKAEKNYVVVNPSEYSAIYYPSLTKYDDANRVDIQAPSVRPFIVHKFSETYLIAAEAAFMSGRTSEAVEYINVLRRRAAYRPENSAAENAAAAQANMITAGDLSLDFILEERSRELAGEQMRWLDLVRTGTLVERVQRYHPLPAARSNIQEHHTLRPIPQSQIDLNTGNYPQNPGY